MTVRVDVDRRRVARELLGGSGPVVQAVSRAARRVQNQAKRNLTSGSTAAVDTGRLRASVRVVVRVEGDKVVATVGTDLDYALYVHEGTGKGTPSRYGGFPGRTVSYRPSGQVIRPRRAKVLRFPAGPGTPPGRVGSGGFVYAREVRGQDAKPFLVKALNELDVNSFRP